MLVGHQGGYLANLFLAPSKKKAAAEQTAPVTEDAHVDVGQLKALIEQQQTALDEINLLLRADRT